MHPLSVPLLALLGLTLVGGGLVGCGEPWDDWLYGDPAPQVGDFDDGFDFRDRRERPVETLPRQIAFHEVVAEDDTGIVTHAVRPRHVEATKERLRMLRMPEGFTIEVFAKDVGRPRMLVEHKGVLYVSQPHLGEVWALHDTDRDGQEDERERVVAELPGVHGLVFHEGRLYLATPTAVWVADIDDDGSFSAPQPLVKNLPEGGQHPNRTLKFSPEGELFVSVGSSCNACDEENREHATLLRVDPETGRRAIFASGLRNTIGFGWHPFTGELWGMDHGSDLRGDDQPPEELNLIVEDGHYGWPYVFGMNEVDPFLRDPPDMSLREWLARSLPAVLTYQAHAAPIEMEFYEGGVFPDEYDGDAFVAMHGSWNRDPPVGYEIVRVHFQEGKAVAIKPFITGFLILEEGEWAQFGRPTGLAIDEGGALYISDDSGGVIFKVDYDERSGT